MKTKHYYLSLIAVVFILTTIIGCNNDINDSPKSYSEYLSINHEIDHKTLTKSEQQTLYKAFSRLNIVMNEYGIIILNTKSGKEINISENIYNYYKKSIENHNQDTKISIKTRIYYDNDSTSIGETEVDSSGCLLYCIQDVMSYFGNNIPYDNIKQNLINHNLYDNGVAPENAYDALSLYFHVNYGNPPYDEQNNTRRKYIMSIWHDTEYERQYHAVEYLRSNNGVAFYYDPQRNCIGYCDMNQIFQFFYISKKY